MRSENGSILIILVYILFSVAGGALIFALLYEPRVIKEDKMAYLKSLNGYYEKYYKENAREIDSQEGVVSLPVVPSKKYRVRTASTGRLNRTGIYYHNFVLILLEDDKTTVNQSTGEISTSQDYVLVVDGFKIQKELYEQTRRYAEDIAFKLEQYHKAKYLADPYHDFTKNYFKKNTCNGAGEFNCTAFATLEDTNVCTVLKINCRKTGWNTSYFFDNFSSSLSPVPPYNCRIGFDTPWGEREWVYAVQEY
ncbi:MAG: hypothetical protein AB1488_06675 [Nitrospirota bacterium]